MDSRDRTLWVGNLSERTTEEHLFELFLQAGPLEKVTIPVKDGRKQKFAFVTFKHECSVPYTIELFDGIRLWGNVLKLQNRTGSTQNLVQNNSPSDNVPSGSQVQFNQSPIVPNPAMQRGHTWHGPRDHQESRNFQDQGYRNFQSHGKRDFHGQGSRDFQSHGSKNFQGHGGSHSRGNSSSREVRFVQEPGNREHISLQANYSYPGNSSKERNDPNHFQEKRERLMNKQKASLEIHHHRHDRRHRDSMQKPYDRGGRSQPWQQRPYRH